MQIGNYKFSHDEFCGKKEIDGSLDLRGLTSIPEGFNPTVGGSLDLRGLTSIPEGFNPTVGGYLYLRGLTSIPEGFNPTVGGYLDLSGLTSIPEGFNPTVGGYLDLSGLTSIPEGFNPTVGGSLYLRGLTSIPEGFNPTVGGYLDLRGLTSIPEGFNPTVGGYLDLRGLTCKKKSLNGFIQWENGYVLIDGILSKTLKKKGNIWTVVVCGKKEKSYIVFSNNKSAHGNTVKEAKESLIYKITDRNTDEYNVLTVDSVLSFENAVQCYRSITGACEFGVKSFVNEVGKKKNYKISEIIEITQGRFGHNVFVKFFEDKGV